MTLTQALTKVSQFINQELTDDTHTITKTEVTGNLNISYREMVNAIIDAGQYYQLRETNADLVDGQSTYSMPTDCKKIQKLELAYESTTVYSPADLVSVTELTDTNNSVGEISPCYALIANGYKIYPTPNSNVEDGIRLFYYENITDLVNDADEFALPLGYEHIPTYYASAMAKMHLGDVQEANSLLGLYRAEIDRMKMELAPRVTSGDDHVVIHDSFSTEY